MMLSNALEDHVVQYYVRERQEADGENVMAGESAKRCVIKKEQRVLLRPWLEDLIERGHVPGLEWMDAERKIFKVPWKHRSKKSWSHQHSSVFLVHLDIYINTVLFCYLK